MLHPQIILSTKQKVWIDQLRGRNLVLNVRLVEAHTALHMTRL
jgi:hypothetical protein